MFLNINKEVVEKNTLECDFYMSNDFGYNEYLNLIIFEDSKILIPMENKFRVENTDNLDDKSINIIFNGNIVNNLFLVKKFNFNDMIASIYFIQNVILFMFNLFFYLGGLIYLVYFYVRK